MLLEMLVDYGKKGVLPMHMPGHKRNTGMLGKDLPYAIDITEIAGFDDLHGARGVLRQISDAAAALYGSERAFLLVNGSTGGILAAVRSCSKPGGKVIMARNCHRSVYSAVEIAGMSAEYLLPEIDEKTGIAGSVRPEQVEKALLDHPDAVLVVVTSPTYEGVVSDVEGICRAAHLRGVPVLVDSAHGAHLGFSDFFPQSAVQCGADIVVMSLHKTLPALTQCALAHISGPLADCFKLSEELAAFQTSSPSYVLMASIDRCLGLLAKEKDALFSKYSRNLEAFYKEAAGLKTLSVVGRGGLEPGKGAFFDFDPGKIVVSTRGAGLTGRELRDFLRSECSIELEMACLDYAVAMTSVCDTPESFERLSAALRRADRLNAPQGRVPRVHFGLPRRALPAAEARVLLGEHLPPERAAGRVALEYVWAYPPGVPLVVPGEIIERDLLDAMRAMLECGVEVKSSSGRFPDAIRCSPPGGERPRGR